MPSQNCGERAGGKAEEEEEEGEEDHERPVLRRGDEPIRAHALHLCIGQPLTVWDDDGDFDDLYGNAPNKTAAVGKATATAAADPRYTDTDIRAHQSQMTPASARSSVDNGAYSYPVSPVSSIPSTTYSRSDTGAGGGGISNGGLATPGSRVSGSTSRRANQQTVKQKKQSAKAKSASRRAGDAGTTGGREHNIRRKGSEELFSVDWDDDDAVKACFLCSSSFSLMKRKHHCRKCGHVMCSDCSVFRYFEISHKKHRVCTTCNNELARANRLGDSDAEESLDRSAVTDDDAEYAYATPSNSSRKKRSKLRENLKKTFTPKHDKKKEARQSTAQLERRSVVENKTERADQVVQPKQREGDEQKQSSDLFDLADDTWFTDPLVGGNGTTKRKDRHLNLDHDTDDFMQVEHTQTRSSAGQSKERTAAEEWQDATSRQMIAANGGARVPPRGTYDSLSIDAYASRGEDEFDQRRGRMEMPRPEQQQQQRVVARVSTTQPEAEAKQPEKDRDDRFSSHGRPTLKESLKDIFHVHGKKNGSAKRKEKGKEKREGSSESEGVFPSPPPPTDGARSRPAVGPAQPAVFTQARPTFYDADADELVVDDTPGYFDRASREHFRSPTRGQRIPTDSTQWGASLLPKSVEPRAITSDQESYNIVEPPTESMDGQDTGEANKSVAPVPSPESNGHGFTGALKRLFGLSSSKSPAKQVSQETPEPVHQAAETEKISSDSRNVDKEQLSMLAAVERQTSLRESNILQRAGSFDRFSMVENSLVPYNETGQQDQFRHTMAAEYATPGGDFRQPNSEQKRVSTFSGATSIRDLSQKKRRDTFDDLFSSPKSQATSSSTGASQSARAWNGIGMESPFVVPPTGVDRFDRRKDDFGAYQEHEIKGLTPSIYAIDRSRASSIGLGESSLSSQRGNNETSRATGTSWSAISAEPSYGAAAYAVPSSVSSDRFASSYARDAQGYTAASPNTHTSIMDDINHRISAAPSSTQRANSVDDIFAEFERPNDYVFDPVTGGYVSASAPKRAREQPVKPEYNPQPSKQEPQSQMYSREVALGQYNQHDSRPAVAESENEDGLDDTIVDKISSLEGELAALKQLIRKRKDHDQPPSTSRNSQATAHRSSSNQAVPSRADDRGSRKLSIFDNASSDEDVVLHKKIGKKPTKNKGALEISPLKGSRKSQKKTSKRRDSFADLFEDSPTEGSALGGGKGYESLFQTGSGKESGSDDEVAPLQRRQDGSVKSSVTTRAGRKNAQRAAESDDDEDYPPLQARVRGARDMEEEEEDYPSLKNRSKSSSRPTTKKPVFRAAADSVSLSDDEEKPLRQVQASPKPTDPKERRPKKSTKPSRAEFDPIDALFDSSSERDVTNFFDFADEKKTAEESRDRAAKETTVESPGVDGSNGSQVTKSSDLTTENEIPATEEADSDEEFAISLAKAKKRRSQPESLSAAETTTSSGAAQAKKEASSSGDNSEIDSDEEFALTLKKGRPGVLKPASPDVRPVFPDAASSELALQESSLPIAKDEVNAIDSDEEFALSLKTKKVSRGKRVSFFDQPKEESKSSHPTLGLLDEMLEGPSFAEESVLPAAVDQDNVLDDFDSVVSSPPRSETNLAGEAEAINHSILESPGSEVIAMESAQDPADVLVLNPDSSDQEAASKSSVQVTEADPVQTVDPPAEAITAAVEDTASKGDPVKLSPRESVQVSGLEDVSLDIFDQSSDVYSVSLGSTDVVDEESEGESDGEDAYSEAFSFEVKPKKRAVQAQATLTETLLPKRKVAEDDGEALILGKYASAAPAQQQYLPESTVDPAMQEPIAADLAASSSDADLQQLEPTDEAKVDWQQMQEQEKERKKKLQLKQRQAQRDKLLKKQGASSKQLSAPNSSSSASSSSTGEKKKKKKDKSAPDSSTPRKKSSSSKKHRHKSHADDEDEQSKENIDSSTSTLTEL